MCTRSLRRPMHTTSLMLRPVFSAHTGLQLTFRPATYVHCAALPRSTDFQRMCEVVGVDALASQKGFWSQVFGVGDFYYKLGVTIVDVCLSTRGKNGGIMLNWQESRSEAGAWTHHTPFANSDVVVNVARCCACLFLLREWNTFCQLVRHVRFIRCVAFVIQVVCLHLFTRCSH
jgi:hypothetical protein